MMWNIAILAIGICIGELIGLYYIKGIKRA